MQIVITDASVFLTQILMNASSQEMIVLPMLRASTLWDPITAPVILASLEMGGLAVKK